MCGFEASRSHAAAAMRGAPHRAQSRLLPVWTSLAVAVVLSTAAGCRSAETSLTGPSGSKCSLTLSFTGGTLPAAGGTATIGVTTGRECTWNASATAGWLSVGPASGQGSGSVAVSFTSNPDTSSRQAPVTIGEQTIVLSQAAAACVFAISPQTASVPAGTATVPLAVTTQPGCAWTAVGNVPWLTVRDPAGGSGNGQVVLDVQANGGPERTGTATIAAQTFTVTQAGVPSAVTECSYALSPTSRSIGAGGGSGSFDVVTPAGCEWSVSGGTSWLRVTDGENGSGSGTVSYAVDANTGTARRATIVAGGESFTVAQDSGAPACSFRVDPTSRTFDAGGGASSVAVTAPSGCEWNVSASASWIRIPGGPSGSGTDTVRFEVDANPGPPRTGILRVAGESVQISQSGCSFSIAPTNVSSPSGGGPGSVAVTATSGCSWSARSNDSWITITAGSTGSGSGTVSFSAAANTGGARTGSLTAAGLRVTVEQAAAPVACSYTVTPASQSFGAAGGSANADVSAAASCPWTATSSAPWVRVVSGASGSGPGRVTYQVDANPSTTARAATVTVAGQVVSISQAGAPCSYSVSASSQSFPAIRSTSSITVTAPTGCIWAASSGAPWIQITGGTVGNGNGTVSFVVEPNNTGQARSAGLTIQGITVTINQSS
jgi:hypothetical protein